MPPARLVEPIVDDVLRSGRRAVRLEKRAKEVGAMRDGDG